MPQAVRSHARHAADPVPVWWPGVCAAAAIVAVLAVGLSLAWKGGSVLGPVLAIPVALSGIRASSARMPLAYGAVMLAVIVVLALFVRGVPLWIAAAVSVATASLLAAVGVVLNEPGRRKRARLTPVEQKLANVTSVAEVVQRALLPPLPQRVGPLELEVVYLAAAAEARVGGDLYEVARTPFGIRLVVGDVRGKGLEAVEIAAGVLGVFREVAHEVYTLAEMARRIDASLGRRSDAGQPGGSGRYEEFVTVVLAEIDPCVGNLTLYNCGHPSPILLSPGRGDRQQNGGSRSSRAAPAVTALEVPSPAPPLRLLSLGDCSAAGRTLPFPEGGALLLYTDGVTEARNLRHRCYPLAARLTELAQAGAEGIRPDLLERVREDLLRHVGAPLDDDAALVLVRAPAVWGDQAIQPGTGIGSRFDAAAIA
jgi:hypothetical protein